MTPKDKTNELILKFAFKGAQHEGEAKKFALLAVNEILYVLNEVSEQDDNTYAYNAAVFYNLVKTELKNI